MKFMIKLFSRWKYNTPNKTGNYLAWVRKHRPDGTFIEHEAIVWFSLPDEWNTEPFSHPHTAFKSATVICWMELPNPPKK